MTEKTGERTLSTTRRSTMQLLAGGIVGAAGISTATAKSTDWEAVDDGETSQWILRLDDPVVGPATETSVSVHDLKSTAVESQESVLDSLSEMDGVDVRNTFWIANAILVSADRDEVEPFDDLQALDGVSYVHPNFEIETPEPVDEQRIVALDNDIDVTYGLDQIAVPEVWEEFDSRGEGARVAVLDTGVDADHPDIDLADGGWAEFDEEGEEIDSDPNDPDGHGTHVSGTIVGGDESGTQIGVAPEAELYNGKVLDNGGTFAQIIGGMEWAHENDADVINMSLGADGFFEEMIEPVQNAVAAGTLVVSSSGNDGPGTSGSPANVYDTTAVGATNRDRAVTEFSSGEQVHTDTDWDESPDEWPSWYTVPNLSAPGEDVFSALPGGGYGEMSGTSMASPHVAGVAALIAGSDDELDPEDIHALIEDEVIHPDGEERDTRYGRGITNAFRSRTAQEYDGVVTGQVTDPDGSELQGVRVTSGYGTAAVTDHEGRYRLPVPEAETTLEAGRFGEFVEAEIDVDGETEQNLELEPILDVDVNIPIHGQPQPIDMAAGGAFEVDLAVANLEELEVQLGEVAEEIDAENVELELLGETFHPNDSITFDEPITDQDVSLTVRVPFDGVGAYADEDGIVGTDGLRDAIEEWREGDIETDLLRDVIEAWRSGEEVEAAPELDGTWFELVHTFSGLDQTIEDVSTGTTEVLVDPDPPNFEITDPNFDDEIGTDRTLEFAPTIENTGELTDTQQVIFQLDVAGVQAAFPATLWLTPGDSYQIEYPITFGDFPRVEGTQWIFTDDDSAEGTFRYLDDDIYLLEADAPETISAGEELSIDVEYENVGELDGGSPVALYFDDRMVSDRVLEAPSEEEAAEEYTVDTDGILPGTYAFELVRTDVEEELFDEEIHYLEGAVTIER